MDSLTQITLGAAVGEAVAGREAGKRAPLWGAALGTVPDLDVLANPLLTEAQSLLFHRGPTHSLLFVALLTPLVGLALSRLHTGTASRQRWMALVGAVLLTHIGLDCLTSYGTQLFWPFSRYPVILATVFIIDPMYTVPLAAGLLGAMYWPSTARPRRIANYAGLALSSAYLLFTVVNKLHVNYVFAESLRAQGHAPEQILTKPTPFNNVLWTGIAETENRFLVGYYSLLDDDEEVRFRSVPKQHDLLGEADSHPMVERLRWFSRGYFAVRRTADGTLRIVDLRFGRSDLGLTDDGEYIFSFRLVENESGEFIGLHRESPDVQLTRDVLRQFFNRVRGGEMSSQKASEQDESTIPLTVRERTPELSH